jgi:hypothetical protein
VPGLFADLQALIEMDAAARRHQGKRADPAGSLFLMTTAVLLLCKAPKTRIVDWAFMHHLSDHAQRREIPDEALDVHTQAGRKQGRGWVHFLEESGRIIDPDVAARSRGFESTADELRALGATYEQAFEKQHTGRRNELAKNPWAAKPSPDPDPPAGVQTLFEEAP